MKILVETDEGGFKVDAGDGQGWLWTPDPEQALREVRYRLERFIIADLTVRRDGAPRHVRVLAGTCPTCGLPASDCLGTDL